MRRSILVIYFTLLSFLANSQINVDSLWGVWHNPETADTTKMLVLKDLIEKGYLFSNPDTAFIISQTLYDRADSLGFESWKSTALNYQGISCAIRGRYDEAIQRFTLCLQISEEIGNQHRVASSLSNIGQLYREMEDLPKALEYYNKSKVIYTETDDQYGLGIAYANSATLENSLGKHEDAIASALKAQEYCKKVGNLPVVANMDHELAVAYFELHLRESNPAKKQELKQLSEASFDRSLVLKRQVGDKEGEANTLVAKANTLKTLGRNQEAIELSEQALEIAKIVGSLAATEYSSALLYELYERQANYRRALEMNVLSIATRDSIQSDKNQREIIRQEYKYSYEKQAFADSLAFANQSAIQSLEIEKRDANLSRQRIALLASGGGVLLLILLVLSVRQGKRRSDELLHNILPAEIAAELKAKGSAQSKRIDQVTVLFTDFKGFTTMAEQLSPKELVDDLNECFSEFDRITAKYGIEKIKTIGDSYMAAGGLPTPNTTNPVDVIKAALEIRDFIEEGKSKKQSQNLPYFEIRIGVHTGPVVAGIVGVKKFQYDIWGDTVNTASTMESSGTVGRVNISEATYKLLKDHPQFSFESRGKVEAKGKGALEMYFVSEA